MNEKVRIKINEMKIMAKTQNQPSFAIEPSQDSLSKIIRNEREAKIFRAELQAAIQLARIEQA